MLVNTCRIPSEIILKFLNGSVLLFSFFWLLPINQSSAQRPVEYFEKAGALYAEQSYDSALIYIDLAIEGYRESEIRDTLLSAYNTKAQYVLMKEGWNASIELLDEVLDLGEDYFGDNQGFWLEVYYQYANAYEVGGDYTSGLEYVDRMLDIANGSGTVSTMQKARAYSMAARLSQAARKHRAGIQYGKKSCELFLIADPDTPRNYYATLNTLAGLYLFNSQYDSAVHYNLLYLEGVKEIYGESHFNVGVGYNQIAGIQYNLNRYTEALKYFSKAEDVFQKYYEDTGQDLYVNIIRTNTALVYLDLHEYDLALDYALSVWPADLRNYGQASPKLLYTLGRLVTSYHALDDLASADIYVNYIRRILDANPDMTPSNKCYALNYILSHEVRNNNLKAAKQTHEQYVKYYEESGESINKTYVSAMSELARAYRSDGSIDKAVMLHKSAIAEYLKLFSPQHRAIFNEYLNIAQAYADIKPALAYAYLDTAMATRIHPMPYRSFSDAIAHCPPSPLTIEAVKLRLSLLWNNQEIFEQAIEKIDSIVVKYDQFIELYFMVIRSQSRISDLASDNDDVYAFAVKRFLKTGDEARAFQYAEKNRSLSIRMALNQYESFSYTDIPDDILELEGSLVADVGRYNVERNNLNLSDSARSVARKKYTDAQDAYLEFVQRLKEEYPDYYDLKYGLPEINIEEISANLDPDQTILSYKYLGDELYAFILRNGELTSRKLNTINLVEEISRLSELLNKGQFEEKSAAKIYNDIWDPLDELLTDEVIIVPDQNLHYLSFDLLKDRKDQFLIYKYTLSYAIAADLVFNGSVSTDNKNWLAFAPGFQDSLKQNYIENAGSEVDSSYLRYVQQPWTIDFSEKLEQSGKALVYTASDATEKNFKRYSKNVPVIFIGTHAEVDDKYPNYSKLVLAKPAETEAYEDGYLHTYELYGSKLNTDLAILTACNTGIGQVRGGEGMLSLSHSFAYAGCPSIVMTKWSVDEASSIEIVDRFMQNLQQGMQKNEALTQAKRSFIENNAELSGNPSYWAGLSLIGNPEPILKSTSNLRWIVILIITILLIFAGRKMFRLNK